jgi:tetratricopeptide (TPR) repeat protein
MSQPTQPEIPANPDQPAALSPGPAIPAPPSGRRRALLLLGAAALAVALGWWLWPRNPGPEPPEIVLTGVDPASGEASPATGKAVIRINLRGVDPAIVEVITAAREEVLRVPRSGTAWGELGMVLRAHDFADEANCCFAEAERLDPTDARWPYLRALTLWLTDPDAALPLLERAVELHEDASPEPRLRLAENLLARGRLDEAEKHFRHVLESQPDHPRAHLGLGRLAYRRDRLDACVDHLRRVADHPCARKAARTVLAQVYARRKDPAAVRKLGPVAALPDDVMWPDPFVQEVVRLQVGLGVQLGKADELLRHGQARQGVALLRETAERYPEAERAWLALGRALIEVKDFAAAEQALAKAAALAPQSVRAWYQLGRARYGRGDYRPAADAFARAARLKPNDAAAHYELGRCLQQLGDRKGAVAAFRAALHYKPEYAAARTALTELSGEGRR